MSKRIIRVLSMALTLVMMLSLSTPAFAWGGGDIGNGWDRQIGEDDFREFTPAEEVEEEEVFDYFQTSGEGGYQVTVEAPMGSLPMQAELHAEPVEIEEIREAVESVVEGEANILVALDISFWMNGIEIEPEEAVRVKISAEELMDKTNLSVVHIPDGDEPEKVNLVDEEGLSFALGTNEVAFEASSFSVYAVVEDGDTGDYARVEVNFFNGENKIATMYVKNKDRADDAAMEQIVYDPGAGEIPAGQMFVGWTTKQDYTAADVENALTIEDVRTALKGTAITEGMDPINYYAMIFSAYNVTYLDELGVTIKTETLYAKGGEAYKDYEVNEPYTPRDQDANFEGWNKLDAEGNPTGEPIARGTKIDLTESIVLKAYVPKGNWLEFRENGQNVSYTAPQFLHSGEKAQEPTPPTRHGYTFGGWYYNAECTGDQFDFVNTIITERTTLYAKWTPVATAPYTVIIWKQNVDGENYDFEEAITINGNVGDAVAVSQQGTGNNAYARINNSNYQYNGFHLDNFTQNVTVLPEGNAVVNVYYNRTEYTLTFQVYRNRQWTTVKEIKALYQQNISANFPIVGSDGTTYTDSRWDPQSSTPYSEVLVYIDIMPAANVTFHRDTANYTTKNLFLVTQCLPGTEENADYTFTSGGTDYYFDEYKHIEANYNFFTQAEDHIDLVGFKKSTIFSPTAYSTYNASTGEYSGRQNNVWRNSNAIYVFCFYERETYTINYMDGEYVTGRNAHIMNKKDEQIGTSDSIYYGADISSYNKGGENYKDDMTRDGYVFEGWYLDETCTREADFTVMPQGGITVYAKWRQIEYRVFLHPNVPTSDTSFDMGGQATSFRVPEGGQINDGGDIGATRDEYTLIGWYLDEECTDPFNSSVFYFHESNTADYAQEENTELDKYGNPTETGNKDKNENRYWITHKLDLYAKWRSKLIGANGITVVFDAGEGQFAGGETTWTDPSFYLDQADCPGAAASTPTDNTKAFKNWVLYKWNGSDFVATETKVLPGETFKVLKANAKAEEITDGTQTEDVYMKYTVKLVAEYGEPEEETPTSITWYSNIQDVAGLTFDKDKFTGDKSSEYSDKGYFIVDDEGADGDLKINEAVAIRGFDTWAYPGYTFLGWAKLDQAGDEGASITTVDQITEDNLFLKWVPGADGAEGHFTTADGKTVTKIAADEKDPHQMLVAVWKGEFYVYHSGVEDGNVETVAITKDTKTYDLTQHLTTGTLYGGYYLEGGFSSTKANTGYVAYDGTNWTWTTPVRTVAGNAITPVAGTTYYIKEVPADKYLQPYLHYTYKLTTGELTAAWLISNVDDAKYKETGFLVISTNEDKAKVCNSLTVQNTNQSQTTVKLTTSLVFGVDGGYLTYLPVRDANGPIASTGFAANCTIKQYWVTPDGLVVTSANARTYKTIGNHNTINGNAVDLANNTAKSYIYTLADWQNSVPAC